MFSNTCNQCGYCKRRNHLPIFYAKIVEMFGYTKGIVCPKPTSHWKDRDTSLLYCKSSLLCWIIYMLCFKSYFLASYQQQAVKKNKAKTIQCLFGAQSFSKQHFGQIPSLRVCLRSCCTAKPMVLPHLHGTWDSEPSYCDGDSTWINYLIRKSHSTIRGNWCRSANSLQVQGRGAIEATRNCRCEAKRTTLNWLSKL